MFNERCIIYGGGELGTTLAACLTESGQPPLFAWDKNADGDIPIKSFAEVRFPDFNSDTCTEYFKLLIVVCLADSQARTDVVRLLHSVGFLNVKEISNSEEIFNLFNNEIKSKFSWISKNAAKSYNFATKDVLWSESVVFPLYTRYMTPNSKVLDIGAGQGRLSSYLSKLGFNVMAFDISKEQLEFLHKKYPKIDFRVGDAKNLPFNDNSFDAVTSQWFMGHFSKWKELCSEQIRVCKVGGIVAFDFSFHEHYLYAQAALGKLNIEHIIDGAVYNPNSRKHATTYKELDEFCHNNGCIIQAIMPHSFFVLNQFIEGSISQNEINLLKEYIQQNELEKNIDLVNVLKIYENNIISRLPYWFTRVSIVVLRKLTPTSKGK